MLSPEQITRWSTSYRDSLSATLRRRARRAIELADQHDETAREWLGHPGRATGVGLDSSIEHELQDDNNEVCRALARTADTMRDYAAKLITMSEQVQPSRL